MINAILFDLDGVLLNSTPVHAEAYRKALATVGIRRVDYSPIAGMTTECGMRRILKNSGLAVTAGQFRQLTALKRRFARVLMHAAPPVASGAGALLRRLSSRVRLGLVTSASPSTTACFFRATKMRPLFSAVITSSNLRHSKPHPEPYRLALKKLRITADQAIAVEDSISGIRSARRAGLRVVAVSGTAPRSALRRAGASVVRPQLQDLSLADLGVA